MDRLEAMRVFVVAVDSRSFAAAARVLKRSPSAVSRAIGLLETHVGAALFHRTTRSMHLTVEGTRYYESCSRVLADIEEALSRAAPLEEDPREL